MELGELRRKATRVSAQLNGWFGFLFGSLHDSEKKQGASKLSSIVYRYICLAFSDNKWKATSVTRFQSLCAKWGSNKSTYSITKRDKDQLWVVYQNCDKSKENNLKKKQKQKAIRCIDRRTSNVVEFAASQAWWSSALDTGGCGGGFWSVSLLYIRDHCYMFVITSYAIRRTPDEALSIRRRPIHSPMWKPPDEALGSRPFFLNLIQKADKVLGIGRHPL